MEVPLMCVYPFSEGRREGLGLTLRLIGHCRHTATPERNTRVTRFLSRAVRDSHVVSLQSTRNVFYAESTIDMENSLSGVIAECECMHEGVHFLLFGTRPQLVSAFPLHFVLLVMDTPDKLTALFNVYYWLVVDQSSTAYQLLCRDRWDRFYSPSCSFENSFERNPEPLRSGAQVTRSAARSRRGLSHGENYQPIPGSWEVWRPYIHRSSTSDSTPLALYAAGNIGEQDEVQHVWVSPLCHWVPHLVTGYGRLGNGYRDVVTGKWVSPLCHWVPHLVTGNGRLGNGYRDVVTGKWVSPLCHWVPHLVTGYGRLGNGGYRHFVTGFPHLVTGYGRLGNGYRDVVTGKWLSPLCHWVPHLVTGYGRLGNGYRDVDTGKWVSPLCHWVPHFLTGYGRLGNGYRDLVTGKWVSPLCHWVPHLVTGYGHLGNRYRDLVTGKWVSPLCHRIPHLVTGYGRLGNGGYRHFVTGFPHLVTGYGRLGNGYRDVVTGKWVSPLCHWVPHLVTGYGRLGNGYRDLVTGKWVSPLCHWVPHLVTGYGRLGNGYRDLVTGKWVSPLCHWVPHLVTGYGRLGNGYRDFVTGKWVSPLCHWVSPLGNWVWSLGGYRLFVTVFPHLVTVYGRLGNGYRDVVTGKWVSPLCHWVPHLVTGYGRLGNGYRDVVTGKWVSPLCHWVPHLVTGYGRLGNGYRDLVTGKWVSPLCHWVSPLGNWCTCVMLGLSACCQVVDPRWNTAVFVRFISPPAAHIHVDAYLNCNYTSPLCSPTKPVRFSHFELLIPNHLACCEHSLLSIPPRGTGFKIPAGSSQDFRMREIVPGDAAGRRVFSGVSRFSRPFIPAARNTLRNPFTLHSSSLTALYK
ncbi:hypothetical protein PR048_033578 [Dryococelus australis]|uniref:Uncharacterized protein n=1 Tax=Dryococelus australis TaxID=614101 RepID=A0ABQ9G4T2_9NEOP|nr:hypothetical protein PR048_033578 [Dryococelus australis]